MSLLIVRLFPNNLQKLLSQGSDFRFGHLILSTTEEPGCISSSEEPTEIIKSTKILDRHKQSCLSNSFLRQAGTRLSPDFAEMLSCSADQTLLSICPLDYHHASACGNSCL